jgi:hypothetical protein
MAEYERNLIWDGFVSLERGIDSGRAASSLERNQCAFAVNTTFRGGYPKSRPRFIKRPLTFADSDGDTDLTLLAAFQDGQFQGAAFYDGITAESSLITSIGGNIYRIQPSADFRVADITPDSGNSSRLAKAWFCQAEEFLLIQDGQSKCLAYDGSAARRLDKDHDLPVGTCMAYGMGRVWVTLPDRFSFVAGDIVYGPSGTNHYGYRDAVLKVTENTFLSEGGAFAVPANSGGIRALTFTNNLDTSLGQGPLLAFTPNLIASVNAPIDRTVWKDLQYPIQTVAMTGYGALSDNGTVAVNGDIFYRSIDGVRTFALARRDFSTWGNTPASAEMNRVLELDTEHLLQYNSSVVFDNRLLSTVSPYHVGGHGVPHRGLAVLDFDILSRMYGKQQPAWEGVWTGLNILQLVKGMFGGSERCFAFVLNAANQVELWELDKECGADQSDIGESPVTWSFEMKSLDYDTPFDLKRLEYGELFVDELLGDLTIKAWFRPDSYPKWVSWRSDGWTESATDTMSSPNSVAPPDVMREQGRYKLKLPRPVDTVDTSEGKPFKHFFSVQPRFEFIGKGRVRQVRIAARPEQEHSRGEYKT